jgi:hypothetical protein
MPDLLTRPIFPDGYGGVSPFDATSIGSCIGTLATPASAAWPSANLGIAIPFRVTTPIKFSNAFWHNGTTVSASYHIDVGIYSADGTKLGSIGSTAQGTASIIQTVALTTEIAPGQFYMAMSCDNASATFWKSTGITLNVCRALGMGQMSSALALPAAFTFAAMGYAYIPVFGLTYRSFV